MIIFQTKQLGDNWSIKIRYGKRITYGLFLHNTKVKSFWSEDALRTWFNDFMSAVK
jgi:hypothetical protein